jgi:DNA-binding CsgD family transcriptional regulator
MPTSNISASPVEICPIGKRCLCGSLTPRRRQVFHRLLLGDGEKQAAIAIGISVHTLHSYTKQLYRHFGVCGRSELMALALKNSVLVRPRAVRHDLGLEESQRQYLLGLTNATGQASTRARILLQCDGTRNDYDIAAEMNVSIRTIERLRQQYVKTGILAVSRKAHTIKFGQEIFILSELTPTN